MCYVPFVLLTQACPTLVMLLYRSINHPVWLNDLGVLLQQQGELDRAIDLFQQALQKFVAAKDDAGIGRTLNNLALVYGQQGQFHRMQSLCQSAAGILEEAGDRGVSKHYRSSEAMALHNSSIAAFQLGEFESARRSIEKAIAIRVAIADKAGEATSFHVLGKIYERLEQSETALCCYFEARSLCQELGDRSGEALNLNAIAALFEQQNLLLSAAHWYQQALAVFLKLADNQQQPKTDDRPPPTTTLSLVETF